MNVHFLQANILIKADGVACVADLGILKVMTDPSVVEPSKATSEHGIIRYMAPEQINPSQFGLTNSNPSKRSDVHSLAMTAYEVCFPASPMGATETLPLLPGTHGDQAIYQQWKR